MKVFEIISDMISDGVEKVRAINRRYAKPRLTMTPAVRISLLVLRVYLLLLVGLLGFKFFSVVMH